MTNNQFQGPIRNVDVLDLLAWEDNRANDYAAKWGRHATDAYFRAWSWLTGVVLDHNRGNLPWNAKQALILLQTSPGHRAQIESSLRGI